MAGMGIPEEEVAEPALNYWKPVPKPPPVAFSPFTPNCVGNGYENSGWPYQGPTYNQPAFHPQYVYHQASYPLNDVIHSYIQNQQIGLSQGGVALETERRRLSQCSLIGTDYIMYTFSANHNLEKDTQTMTDSMIQDEVTRAAKTLFSKRNRTLLHWLNPDINKNQIKIDVNAAWESLPAAEKVFYISQVLGKFSPHVTSLMVNPQLEPSTMESSSGKNSCNDPSCDKTSTSDSKNSSNTKVRRRSKKSDANNNLEPNSQTIKTEIKTENEEICDSGIAMNVGREENLKKVALVGENFRVKRKYTKRKHKESSSQQNLIKSNSNSCPLPVDVKHIKLEPGTEFPVDVKDIKLEPGTEFPVNVKDIKTEPGIEFPVDIKDIKTEPGTEFPVNVKNLKANLNINVDSLLPRPKRKYVKRKLVRKKYKRREPKQKPPLTTKDVPGTIKHEENVQKTLENDKEEMEMDLWIELGSDSILTNEEVDSFFDSIEDPDSLFCELGITENLTV